MVRSDLWTSKVERVATTSVPIAWTKWNAHKPPPCHHTRTEFRPVTIQDNDIDQDNDKTVIFGHPQVEQRVI